VLSGEFVSAAKPSATRSCRLAAVIQEAAVAAERKPELAQDLGLPESQFVKPPPQHHCVEPNTSRRRIAALGGHAGEVLERAPETPSECDGLRQRQRCSRGVIQRPLPGQRWRHLRAGRRGELPWREGVRGLRLRRPLGPHALELAVADRAQRDSGCPCVVVLRDRVVGRETRRCAAAGAGARDLLFAPALVRTRVRPPAKR
jgi:hypothetical protein